MMVLKGAAVIVSESQVVGGLHEEVVSHSCTPDAIINSVLCFEEMSAMVEGFFWEMGACSTLDMTSCYGLI